MACEFAYVKVPLQGIIKYGPDTYLTRVLEEIRIRKANTES